MMIGQNLVLHNRGGSNEISNEMENIKILGASAIKQKSVVKQESDGEIGSEMKFDSDNEHSDEEFEFCVDFTKVKSEMKQEIFDEKSEQKPFYEEEIGLPLQNKSNQKELKDNRSLLESEEAKNCVGTPCAYESKLKIFKCNQSDYASAVVSDLRKHVRTHTGEKPFKCDQCDYACAIQNNLKTHIRTHTGIKPFKCNHCDFASAQSGNLKSHIRTHTGEKPFQCILCDYACANGSDLKIHMRTHSGVKPFKCNQCEYASSNVNNLKKHLLTHTGKRSYEYDLSKKFCQKMQFPSDDPSGVKKQDIRVARALWRPF